MGAKVIVYTYNGGVYEFKKPLVSKDSNEKMFAYEDFNMYVTRKLTKVQQKYDRRIKIKAKGNNVYKNAHYMNS